MRQQIISIFDSWDKGDLTAQTVRHQLEAVIRSAYRSSGAVATEHTVQQSEIPGWRPANRFFSSDYLASMLSDVRSNLRTYKASDKTDKDRRRAVLNIQHSAGVAAQRGYTDALISSYSELNVDFGYELRKFWMANFVNNDPCDYCRALHGTEVGLHDEFPYPKHSKSTKVYQNLQGPPRHPRCRCYLAIIVVTLENALDSMDIDVPTPPALTITTAEVKNMPKSLFGSIVKALQKIIAFIKGIT